MPSRRSALLIAAIATCLATAGCEGFNKFRAVEKSMEPTILSGEILTIHYNAYSPSHFPQPGDIVGFQAPVGAGLGRCGVKRSPRQPCPRPTRRLGHDYYMKRVIAVPGDKVAIRDGGHAYVNGRQVDEPYIQACEPIDRCDFPEAVTVPPEYYFVLGDNRPYSSDSRFWGPVHRSWIEGRIEPLNSARR